VLRTVARYDRIVDASLERAWENVRDWEHLPWLHSSSFHSIALLGQSSAGWQARIGLPTGDEIVLELVIDGARYVSRTLEGNGAGTEIWTELQPQDETRTHVQVSFNLPGLAGQPDATLDKLGALLRGLYTRLWDEDEAMMIERAAALARLAEPSPRELDLGPREALRFPFDIDAGGQRLRITELGGELRVDTRTCPHWLGPLEPTEDPTVVQCPWHGYRFDPQTRKSCDGRGLRLPAPPALRLDSGRVILDWPSP